MAVTGALLGYLGIGLDAVIWLTSAESLNMHWLTPEIANKYGILLSYDESAPPSPPRLYAYVPPPGSATPQTTRRERNSALIGRPERFASLVA
jgi:hypothetical protein